MTLGGWDDCGEEMNQEEADQDVADEQWWAKVN